MILKSFIEPLGCIIALQFFLIKIFILSVKGKKASEATTKSIFFNFFGILD